MSKDQNLGADAQTEAAFEEAAKKTAPQRSQRQLPADSGSRAKPGVDREGEETDVAEELQKQKREPHYRIVIPSTGAPHEIKRIPVIPNGVFYTITRDEEVVVPKAVLAALDIATETRYRYKKDGDAEVRVPYKVKSFPYQIIEGPLDPTPLSQLPDLQD